MVSIILTSVIGYDNIELHCKGCEISMKAFLSSLGLEEFINKGYGYAFTRKTLGKLREENIITQPEVISDSDKKNALRVLYPLKAFTEVLAYLLTCDTLRGLARGTKLKNKFSFFYAARVIVDNYKAEHKDNDMQIIESFENYLENNRMMGRVLSENEKLTDISVEESHIVKVISVSLLFFSELIDGKFTNCLYSNWLRFKDIVVESGLGNDCFINNSLIADNSKTDKQSDKQNKCDELKTGIGLWNTESPIIISTLNYFANFKNAYSQEEYDNVVAWLDVVYTFDNSSRWLSKRAYNFLKGSGIELPEDCEENMVLYAALIRDIGVLKKMC